MKKKIFTIIASLLTLGIIGIAFASYNPLDSNLSVTSGSTNYLNGSGSYVAPGTRVASAASSTTPTPNGDITDQYELTALAAGATFGAPTGTPIDGQKLTIRIKDNGTAQTLAWNAIYRASSDLALPTTTIISKTMYLGFIYNSADSKWDFNAFLNDF